MSLDPERTRRAKELFLELLELAPDERLQALAERSANDSALAERVRSLLAADAHAEAVLPASTPLGARPDLHAPSVEAPPLELEPGTRIGPYRLQRLLGHGGFGAVYLAEQEQPVRRQVAVKVVKPGMDTAEVLARFENERRALAVMNHPGIARVLDAGATEAGRPYFAMEWVDGPPITDYVRRRELPLAERLVLFREVCDAVQHAHTKGVLHRDLKPSNVLVADTDVGPVAKVIDFGIARAVEGDLAEATRQTRAGELIGTPACMSPEQVDGVLDVDTRADVYALGALLYELLTGRPPIEFGGSWTDVLRRIRDQEPLRPTRALLLGPRPGGLSSLPSELDWVCLRALEKDRERRYPTARALGDDIGRFLEHEPLEAAPPSRWYRVSKLVRRHRTAAAATVAVGLALLLGIGGLAVGLVRARDAEQLAEQRGQEAERQARIAQGVNGFLTQDLMEPLAPSAEPGRGRDVSLREALDVAVTKLEGSEDAGGRFAGEALVVAAIRLTAGSVYGRLGDGERAVELVRRAYETRREELGPEDPETVFAASELGSQLCVIGGYEEARDLLVAALEDQTRLSGTDHPTTQATRLRLAQVYGRLEERGRAMELLERALAISEEIDASDSEARNDIEAQLAIACARSTQYERAEQLFRRVLERREARKGDRDPDTLASLSNLASFLMARSRYDEALPLMREALAAQQEIKGPVHPGTLQVVANLCDLLGTLARVDEALALLEQTYEEALEVHGPEHPGVLLIAGYLARMLLADEQIESAELLLRGSIKASDAALGPGDTCSLDLRKELIGVLFRTDPQGEEVETLMRTILEHEVESLGPDHVIPLAGRINLGRLLRLRGRLEEAEQEFRTCVELSTARYGDADPYSTEMLFNLVEFLHQQQRVSESEPFARRALAGADELMAEGHPFCARARLLLGVSLLGQSQYEAAEPLLLEAHELFTELGRSEERHAWETAVNLSILYDAWGQPEEAMEWHARMTQAGSGQ